jgi:hypothetical protein
VQVRLAKIYGATILTFCAHYRSIYNRLIRFLRTLQLTKWGLWTRDNAAHVYRAAFNWDAAHAHGGGHNNGGIIMSIDWHNGASDRSRMVLPESYKPKALRLAPTAESIAPTEPQASAECAATSQKAAPSIVDLRKLEAELGRRRIDEIADVMRALTYGEMIELAESMWNIKPDNSELNEDNLPAVLYRWSTSRQS